MPIYKSFNKEFFKEWSREVAYTLGFLFADGNIVITKRKTHFVAFYSADLSLLSLFKGLLRAEHKISKQKSLGGSYYRLQIGSKELFADLLKLGLTPNKTKRLKMPSVPTSYFSDFVRGYFDGDGNVWSGFLHKKRATPTYTIHVAFTSGCKDFLKNLLISLQNCGIKGGSIFEIKNKNCWRLNFSKNDALKLYKIMYNSPGKLYLKRKKLVFDRYIKMRS